ncbi:MAG: hypothetical protein K2X82_18350, partial [Gemmataceae bacterium]|nr:hypothetical protein [Gemmataceae bacterium]
GCAAARDRAARARGLFARAAKLPFPQVRFTPPAAEPSPNGVVEVAPAAATPSRPTGRRAGRAVWAIAAGALIALVPAALLTSNRFAGRYEQARTDADAALARLADARAALERAADPPGLSAATEQVAAADRRAADLLTEWVAADAVAGKDRAVAVSVTGPASAQPGAPNEFVVAVRDDAGSLKGKRVEAVVRDPSGATVHTQPVAATGEARVRVPAGVWAKLGPGTEPTLAVAAVDPETGARTDLVEPVRLFGPVYTTLLTTDKAAYRPGERVLFRSLTLDRVTLRPPAREQVLRYTLTKPDGSNVGDLVGTTGVVRVLDGEAEPVLGPDGQPVRGVGCGAFTLPTADLPDGDYTLSVSELPGRGGVPPAMTRPATRTVKVRAGGPERFTKRITFDKASFAAGEVVEGTVTVRLGDEPVAGAELKAVATADGEPPPLVRLMAVDPGPNTRPNQTDAAGKVRFRFQVPRGLARADVRLLVTVKAEGVEESVAERVPVVGSEVVVEFFPEGGTLVAGVAHRVYVRATAPAGTPVDVQGVVSGPAGEVARVASPTDAAEPGVNRGIGSFTFTPAAGTRYTLTLTGRAAAHALPAAVADGVALTVAEPVTAPGQPVRVTLTAASRGRKVIVGAYLRGRLCDTRRASLEAGKPADVALTIPDARGGVVRVTVWEEPAAGGVELVPVAERLVFRTPGEVLKLAVDTADPGKLGVTATDETGKPAAAILWAAVVNAANVPGPADRSPVAHFLLAGEVRTPDEFEYADFLLSDHPQAGATLDAVLATQGWRRFAEQKHPAGAARAAQSAEAAELVARLAGQPVGAVPPAGLVAAGFRDRYAAAVREADAARAERDAAARQAAGEVRELLAAHDRSKEELAGAAAVAGAAGVPVAVAAGLGWGLAGLGLAVGLFALVRLALPLAGVAVWSAGLGGMLIWTCPTVAPVPEPGPFEVKVPEVGGSTGNGGDVTIRQPGPMAQDPRKQEPPRVLSESGQFEPPGVGIMRDVQPPVEPPPLRIPADFLGPGRPAIRPADRYDPADLAADAEARKQAKAHAIKTAGATAGRVPDAAARVREALMPAAVPLVAREYAAPRPGTDPAAPPADTLLWKPLIVLPADGNATLRVPRPATGEYQVFVAGHTADGRLGAVRAVLPAAPAPPN